MKGLSRRQFLAGGAVAALGGTMALAGCAPMTREEAQAQKAQQAESTDKNSTGTTTAIGSGMGKHGNFDVEVSLKDGASTASRCSTRARPRAWEMWPWRR